MRICLTVAFLALLPVPVAAQSVAATATILPAFEQEPVPALRLRLVEGSRVVGADASPAAGALLRRSHIAVSGLSAAPDAGASAQRGAVPGERLDVRPVRGSPANPASPSSPAAQLMDVIRESWLARPLPVPGGGALEVVVTTVVLIDA